MQLSQRGCDVQVRGEVHHDRRLHVLMLREEEMQWEQGHSKPLYHMRWNPSLLETASSPTDSAGSMHAEYMNLPDAECDQLSNYRYVNCNCWKLYHLSMWCQGSVLCVLPF